ncbi:cobyrinate a,c-diamide synthase [Paraburkholderia tagetis]|uniref:Cobyrinate a,c-diamide synthase n=1 Tax=Paraburkholderia tagetis TaxID=2913261 RepID=A0A9X1RPG8_9BURK|nr:cobyrinate a,c-diamide synthase [Paraburkholderia tagetis]MCG5073277.1 cobyrinate a,c-diamide synthase [Paraburkholderia tagetis]
MAAVATAIACPALFISASASGQGKTTLTAGLARLHRRMGRRVRVFKTGPDFLDPMILERASGAPVMSLDLWMVGEADCRALLAQAAAQSDLILIEGVMGLFDGTPSSADLAAKFGVPVAAIVSANSMAQTFGAIAFGLARYRADVPFHGVLANRVGSPRHAQMLQEGLPADIRWLGHVASDAAFALPDRHLGLHQASEIDDLDARIERAADALAQTELAQLPPAVEFHSNDADDVDDVDTLASVPRLLDGMRIAVARDAAFSFIYPANLALLEALGARVSFFSPLADESAPASADAIYLPGGYPELHAATLARNMRSADSLRAHTVSGRPLIAECGGMLYLLDALTGVDGTRTPMLGLLPGEATMQKRFAALGMQRLDGTHGMLTGHTFHYSRVSTPLAPALRARHAQTGADGEPLYRHGAIVATYMHAYWPSNPAFTAALFHGTAL